MNPLDVLLDDVDLPNDFLTKRIRWCVYNENMKTLGEIIKWPAYEWLRIPNFGIKSLARLEKALAEYGLELAGGRYTNDAP